MAPHTLPVDASAYGHRGFWAQTAIIDWCEPNYELSYYVAEFWNTISNLAFIIPQLVEYIALSKHKSVELGFRRTFLSLALVGIGSLCFHMTLARSMQMFDETSMILVSLHGFYLLFIIRYPNVDKLTLATLLICYGLVFLSLYVFLVAWPIFHHSAFILLVYASMAIGYKLKQSYGPHYKFWTVIIIQHLAFAFWLVDKHYCEVLTQFREHHVPMFLRPAFQFHAIWHILMGLSSHIFICDLIRLRAWTKYKEEFVIRFRWFGLWITLEKVNDGGSTLASSAERRAVSREFPKRSSLNSRKPVPEMRQTNNNNNESLDLNSNEVKYSPVDNDPRM